MKEQSTFPLCPFHSACKCCFTPAVSMYIRYVNRTCDDSNGYSRGTIIYLAIPVQMSVCMYKRMNKISVQPLQNSIVLYFYVILYCICFYIKTIIMTYLFLNNKPPYTVQIFFSVEFSKLWHGYVSTLSVFLYFTLLKKMFWRAILFCVLFPFFRLMCVYVCECVDGLVY